MVWTQFQVRSSSRRLIFWSWMRPKDVRQIGLRPGPFIFAVPMRIMARSRVSAPVSTPAQRGGSGNLNKGYEWIVRATSLLKFPEPPLSIWRSERTQSLSQISIVPWRAGGL